MQCKKNFSKFPENVILVLVSFLARIIIQLHKGIVIQFFLANMPCVHFHYPSYEYNFFSMKLLTSYVFIVKQYKS